MTTRNTVSRWAFAVSIAVFCIAFSFISTAGLGQQLPKPAESTADDSPARPSDDFKSDPLFQEIQRMMLQGGNGFSGKGSAAGSPADRPSSNLGGELNIDSISDARWSAMETLLSAARSLQENRDECTKQGDAAGAAKTHAIVRILRSQAAELLLAK